MKRTSVLIYDANYFLVIKISIKGLKCYRQGKFRNSAYENIKRKGTNHRNKMDKIYDFIIIYRYGKLNTENLEIFIDGCLWHAFSPAQKEFITV